MATNITYPGHTINLDLAVGSGTVSGDVVLIGAALPGVALDDRGADGKATVKTPISFVASLPAEAVDASAGNAIAIGDKLYYDSAATIKVNKDASNGVFIGYALEALAESADGTIQVGIVG